MSQYHNPYAKYEKKALENMPTLEIGQHVGHTYDAKTWQKGIIQRLWTNEFGQLEADVLMDETKSIQCFLVVTLRPMDE